MNLLPFQSRQPTQKGRDPDYEEITPGPPPPLHHPPAAPKEEVAKASAGIVCDLCGTSEAMVRCPRSPCSGQRFCLACDDLYHRHPKRSSHVRKVSQSIHPSSPMRPIPKDGSKCDSPIWHDH